MGDLPERQFMDDPTIKWEKGMPDYTQVDNLYMAERTRKHAAGSLEKTVENLVKTLEMELVHKQDISQWMTIDKSAEFYISTNGGKQFSMEELQKVGTYKAFLGSSPLFNNNAIDKHQSEEMFSNAFVDGFAWEVLDVLSGPPRVSFTWRHWAKFAGDFCGRRPTGETVELYGTAVAKVNDDLKLQWVEFYFDPNSLLLTMAKFNIKDWSACPYINK